LPFNLCMNKKSILISDPEDEFIEYDFNGIYTITRYDTREPSVDFTLLLSVDGIEWVKFKEPARARYAKIISDAEIYGY